MPDDRLKRLAVRRHGFGIDGRDDHAGIRDLRGIAPIASDDADNGGADAPRVLQRAHEVGADVLLDAAAAHREHEHAVFAAQPAAGQPGGEYRVPALVVRPGGELRNVVGRGVGLEAGQLPEVVDGVRAVAGTASDSEEEEPAAAASHLREHVGHTLDGVGVEALENLCGLLEMLSGEAHGVSEPPPIAAARNARVSSSPSGEPIS